MQKIGDYKGFSIYIDGIWILIKQNGSIVLQMRKSYGQNPYAEIDHMIAVRNQPSKVASGSSAADFRDVTYKGTRKLKKKPRPTVSGR